MSRAKCIMVQGTMSGAGKSLLCTALCRIFAQDGYRVAPFKSQNMALNSFVTRDGLEMGRAQVVQAQAAGMEPDVRMNPILLKPSSDVGSQVIVNGEVRGQMPAAAYFKLKKSLIPDILAAYDSLAEEVDIIVIEGAGSPAEINLKADDIVNMGLAKLVDAPVLLAGDIDRGGVFAQLYGTVELLEPAERARIKGLVINKFRGDAAILKPGLTMLEEKTHLPVLGVVVFTIVPLFILIAVAFTNYDQQHMPPNDLFTWVGLSNFFTLFGGGGMTSTFGYSFAKVLTWTLVWAFFATFTTFFGGVFLAMFINNKKTKCPRLWRTLFMITIAVPQFVTLLLVRNFFSDAGICNTMMNNAGVTDLLKTIGLLGQSMDHIPFLTDQHWAKFMIIMINIWVGIPYQMLIATGVLMNIPSDILEASTIDGASPLQCFIYIKLPYLLSVQGPALVTDFVKNVNNFNVIYLLTQDVYITKDQAMASSSAKEVDLLVT